MLCEEVDVNGEPDVESVKHVIPMFGRKHEIYQRCWCSPRDDGENVWIHEASQ